MADCTILSWNSDECRKKKRLWWGIVSVVLIIVVVFWSVVITYMLAPQATSLTNRPILIKKKDGTNHLLILQDADRQQYKQHKLVAKQRFIKVYDLTEKKWLHHSKLISVVPSMTTNKHIYFTLFCPKTKQHYQGVYEKEGWQMKDTFSFPTLYMVYQFFAKFFPQSNNNDYQLQNL
jgi:hypothetical protein